MDIIDKIDLYSHTTEEIRDMEILLEMAMIVDDEMTLNEAFNVADLKKMGSGLLKKLGMHGHKSGEGLISIALKSGKLMAEFIYHTLRGAAGNKDSIERVKEIANTEISQEQFVDFLMKLDMATMHLVTGPLHLLDAWTGWHITAHLKSKVEPMLVKAKKAIADLADAAKGAGDDVKKKLKSLMHGIARLFGLDAEAQQVIKAV